MERRWVGSQSSSRLYRSSRQAGMSNGCCDFLYALPVWVETHCVASGLVSAAWIFLRRGVRAGVAGKPREYRVDLHRAWGDVPLVAAIRYNRL